MNSKPTARFPSDTAIYCAGCNERFQPASSNDTTCPRCGAEIPLSRNSILEQTLLVHVSDEILTAEENVDDPTAEPLDRMIGSDLHVYRFESLLGAGGMGRVYLARHKDLHRRCALKILLPHLADRDAEYVQRFQQEGRAAAALVHPNIVTTHAIGEVDGHHFLEMEFVVGRSLQQLVNDEGGLTPIRATALTAGIAEGLAAAHREQIVHRDLKLDNVLLSEKGTPKISDFGLAKRVATNPQSPAVEQICGTPYYMAPEIFRGEAATKASDVYSLGVCLFLLLTGRLPFVAGSFRDLQAMVTTDPLPSVRQHDPSISLEIAECLSLMMAKSPANRPADGIEAVQLLHAILGQARDVDSLLKEAFAGMGNISWTRQGQRYTLDLTLSTLR